MERITVQTRINAPLHIVWDLWINPDHVVNWNTASDDWHTTSAVNDFRVGGHFTYHMEAKNENKGFRYEGKYDHIVRNSSIEFTMPDGRRVHTTFREKDNMTEITETFDAESQNSAEMQREGWQAILDRFKYYVELNEKEL